MFRRAAKYRQIAWVPGRWDAGQEHRRSGDGRLVLVAADDSGHVVAFIDLEPDGHIDRVPIHNYRMAKTLGYPEGEDRLRHQ